MTFSTSTLRKFSRSRWALAGLVLACCSLGLFASHRYIRARGETAIASRLSPLSLRFEPGSVLRYRVTWSGQQRGRLFAANAGATDTHATSATDMALEMVLAVESADRDQATLILSFTQLERYQLEVLGGSAFPSHEQAAAALLGRHARIRIGADGASRDVAFEQGTPDVFMNIVQWVVAQSAVSLGPSASGSAWDATERGPFGASRVHYSQNGQELARDRVEYLRFDAFANSDPRALRVSKLAGNSLIRLRSGALDLVRTEEAVRVDGEGGESELDGQVRFELCLLGRERGSAPAGIAYGAPNAAGEPMVGADTVRQLLEQRVDGLTREQLLSDLQRFGNGGVMPAHTRWLWRATGLLKQDPALAAELAKIALAAGTTDKARTLVMDLLASVGHAEAQAAMRTILESPTLAHSPLRTSLLQRVSFLEAPAAETISTVWEAFREGKRTGESDLAYSSAHALAAASRAAAANGDPAVASEIVARLGGEIASSTTPEAKAILLGALSNASGSEVLAIAKPYAKSEDAGLREAAADALRNVQTDDATGLLLDLVGDSALDVQSVAVASLRGRELTTSNWKRIADLMTTDRIRGDLDGALLTLATSYLGVVPETKAVIAQIAMRPQASAAIRARAQAMLADSG